MPNITLSIDEDIVKKVRKIAVDKNTTLTAMVREYLKSVAECDRPARERALRDLHSSFKKLGRDMGRKTWKRDDLHER